MIQKLSTILLCTISWGAWGQTTLYVSPNGSGNAYTLQSPGNLEQVMQKASNGSIIYLKGGTYHLSKTLLVDRNVSFRSVPGEQAMISGGRRITGWTSAGNGVYKAKVPAGSRFRQLYVNGKMAVRARTPNRQHKEDYGPYNRIQRFDEQHKTILVVADELQSVKKTREVELVINQHWYQSRVRIDTYETNKDTAVITVQEPERKVLFGMTGNKMLWPQKPYYFENAREFLDEEQEWYLDREADILYYKPAGGRIARLEVVIPVLETLVQVSGTEQQPLEGVSFTDIAFRYSNWLMPDTAGSILTQGAQLRGQNVPSLPGLMEVAFVRNFGLEHCTVSAAGANGVVFSRGVWNSRIFGNHIHEISANAIVIDTYKKINPPQTLQCRDNLVAQNLIENIGLHYTNGMGLIASCVAGLVIEHNEIRYGRYSGMQIGNHYGDKSSGTQDNIIRFNNIHHVMQLHDDGGAIYTLSNQKGTQICSNWIHDYTKCSWADNYPVNGVFLDNNSAFILVKDNVFTDLPNVDHLKENKGTKVHDNVFENNDSQDEGVKNAAGITGKR
jgi:hypothetical protein